MTHTKMVKVTINRGEFAKSSYLEECTDKKEENSFS